MLSPLPSTLCIPRAETKKYYLPDSLATRIAVQTWLQKVFTWSVTGWRQVKPLLPLGQVASADDKRDILCSFRWSSDHFLMFWANEILAIFPCYFWQLLWHSSANSLYYVDYSWQTLKWCLYYWSIDDLKYLTRYLSKVTSKWLFS